jgi:hypothetical protein
MLTTFLLIVASIAAGNLVHHHHCECGERRRDPRAYREPALKDLQASEASGPGRG